MKLADFDFPLPEVLIAQHPLEVRDHSRLMVARRSTREISHHVFHELPELLPPDHLIVLNNTKVFPARLRARREGRAESIEVLLVQEIGQGVWRALVRPGRKLRKGETILIGGLKARTLGACEDGSRLIEFDPRDSLRSELDSVGEPPLPPYIRRPEHWDFSEDRERYQTVYARHSGSVAAPTAGLHFTPRVLHSLSEKGFRICEILLHVGYGTFQPVRSEDVESHRMDPEYFEVGSSAADCLATGKREGRRLMAVGTTVTRVLEYLAQKGWEEKEPASGYCDLFIYPGHRFRWVDCLLTNFHLPKSTLFMLVCAFAGREFMLECYRTAIALKYRFFSYGDCMLIL